MSFTSLATLVYLASLVVWSSIQKRPKSAQEFNVAGRSAPGLTIGISYFVTFLSTNTLVGLAGISYRWGYYTWIIGALFVFSTWLSWTVFAGPFRELSELHDSQTLPELLGRVTGSSHTRAIGSLVIIFADIIMLQALLRGCGSVLAQQFHLPLALGVAIAWLSIVIYCVLGGLRAVLATDIVQALLVVLFAVVLPALLLLRVLQSEVASSAYSGGQVNFSELFRIGLAGSTFLLIAPRQTARYYAVSLSAIKRARVIALGLMLISYGSLLPIGYLARNFLPQPSTTDEIVPQLLQSTELVPAPLATLFLCALLSAALSSIDSTLLVVASTTARDVLRIDGQQNELSITRGILLVASVPPALMAAFSDKEIVELATTAASLIGAAFLAPSIWFIVCKRQSKYPALVMILGILSATGWRSLSFFRLSSHTVASYLIKVPEVLVGFTFSMLALLLFRSHERSKGKLDSFP